MADKLFPGQDAVGKSFYSWGDNPIRIVGVVDHLVRPSDQGGPAAHEYSMIFPLNAPYSLGGNYLLRTEPGRRAEVRSETRRVGQEWVSTFRSRWSPYH